ncbi:MAG: hypothetical protein ACRDOK_18925, partial [Streptosporangiaceae bacterium]
MFSTFAVALMVIVTGFGPQLKVMTPPSATAWTTAADVQLPGDASPMTCAGSAVSTGWAAGGTGAVPYPYSAGWTAPGGDGEAAGLGGGPGLV